MTQKRLMLACLVVMHLLSLITPLCHSERYRSKCIGSWFEYDQTRVLLSRGQVSPVSTGTERGRRYKTTMRSQLIGSSKISPIVPGYRPKQPAGLMLVV